jgi:SAM-dependent methyltransferase
VARAEFVDDDLLTTTHSTFRCRFLPMARHEGELLVRKRRELVEKYIALGAGRSGEAILELGICDGGSTALIAELFEPSRLIAVDLVTDRAPDLDAYIRRQRAGEIIRPYYGVDQADRPRLLEILRSELPDGHLDLVFDDASHFLAETRASFETLFPLLRPGGLYVIEDWRALHQLADVVFESVPMPAPGGGADRGRVEAELMAFLTDGRAQTSDAFRRRLEQMATERTDTDATEAVLLGFLVERFHFDRIMTRLVFELTLAQMSPTDAIREVRTDADWLTIQRGTAELDPDTFSLASLYEDHLGYLAR